MSEPTKEQIEEAYVLRNRFLPNSTNAILPWLPLLIAHVRTQATNDALERAACLLDNAPVDCASRKIDAAEIRAMKVPT